MSANTIMTNNNRTIIFDGLIVRTTKGTGCTHALLRTKKKLLCPFKCPLNNCKRYYKRSINKLNAILLIELTSLNCSEIISYEKIELRLMKRSKCSKLLIDTELSRTEVSKINILNAILLSEQMTLNSSESCSSYEFSTYENMNYELNNVQNVLGVLMINILKFRNNCFYKNFYYKTRRLKKIDAFFGYSKR